MQTKEILRISENIQKEWDSYRFSLALIQFPRKWIVSIFTLAAALALTSSIFTLTAAMLFSLLYDYFITQKQWDVCAKPEPYIYKVLGLTIPNEIAPRHVGLTNGMKFFALFLLGALVIFYFGLAFNPALSPTFTAGVYLAGLLLISQNFFIILHWLRGGKEKYVKQLEGEKATEAIIIPLPIKNRRMWAGFIGVYCNLLIMISLVYCGVRFISMGMDNTQILGDVIFSFCWCFLYLFFAFNTIFISSKIKFNLTKKHLLEKGVV
ncbi:MAG: hypothetical protein MK052_03885 [Alphaproteobacteria bacterium]|nr:hypothetical protein [Alphaproteobacteria bacterium]